MPIDVQILRKIAVQKKSYGKFLKNFKGGPRSQGVSKFYEEVGVVDRGPRGLTNGVKILALRRSNLELN